MMKLYEEHSCGSHIISVPVIIIMTHFVCEDGLVTTRSNKTYYMVNNFINQNTYNQLYQLARVYIGVTGLIRIVT